MRRLSCRSLVCSIEGALDYSSLLGMEWLFAIMPYRIVLPSHPRARHDIVEKHKDTCERRAVALFGSLQLLLPVPLMAIATTTVSCDMSLFILIFARHLVDGSLIRLFLTLKPVCESDSPRWSEQQGDRPTYPRMPASVLLLFGSILHAIQFWHFYTCPNLIASPYGFCSNIFLLLITSFTSYSIWVATAVCVLKNASITWLFINCLGINSASPSHPIEYFYAYWSSCAIVLVVVFPMYLETVGRITAELQAKAYKTHMHDLLRAVFDACVWVDSALRVQEEDAKLDCLFQRPMKRRSLLQHVAEKDRSRFEAYVGEAIRSGATGLCHAGFVCESMPFEADVYITSRQVGWWLGQTDTQQHLLGFRVVEAEIGTEKWVSSPQSFGRSAVQEAAMDRQGGRSMGVEGVFPGLNPYAPSESVLEERLQMECPECKCTNTGMTEVCILCGSDLLVRE